MLCYLFVPLKIVCRVICGADRFYVELAYQRLASELWCRQFGVALFEDFPCSSWVKGLFYTEYAAEFEVAPVVKGITQGVWHGLRPFLECLPCGVFSSCDIVFAHSVCAHGPPFVMVAGLSVNEP